MFKKLKNEVNYWKKMFESSEKIVYFYQRKNEELEKKIEELQKKIEEYEEV